MKGIPDSAFGTSSSEARQQSRPIEVDIGGEKYVIVTKKHWDFTKKQCVRMQLAEFRMTGRFKVE